MRRQTHILGHELVKTVACMKSVSKSVLVASTRNKFSGFDQRISISTISAELSSMMKDGFIESKDGTTLSITEKGLKKFHEILAAEKAKVRK